MGFGKRATPPGAGASPPASVPTAPPATSTSTNIHVLPSSREREPTGESKPSYVQLNEMLMAACSEQGRIHTETYLTTLGALLGFAVQKGFWEVLIKSGNRAIKEVFLTVGLSNGETVFLSPAVDEMLTTMDMTKTSILFAVSVPMMRAKGPLPDFREMVHWRNTTLGGPEFGVPRIAASHQPHELPRAALNRLWGPTRRLLERNAIPPSAWAIELAAATLQTIEQTAEILSPSIATTLVMEAAIPMSVVDPATVPGD
jgi:hypothetical protein